MKGIHANIYQHCIYIKDDSIPIKQLRRRMNPTFRDIVKEELQKLIEASFIYPN